MARGPPAVALPLLRVRPPRGAERRAPGGRTGWGDRSGGRGAAAQAGRRHAAGPRPGCGSVAGRAAPSACRARSAPGECGVVPGTGSGRPGAAQPGGVQARHGFGPAPPTAVTFLPAGLAPSVAASAEASCSGPACNPGPTLWSRPLRGVRGQRATLARRAVAWWGALGPGPGSANLRSPVRVTPAASWEPDVPSPQ